MVVISIESVSVLVCQRHPAGTQGLYHSVGLDIAATTSAWLTEYILFVDSTLPSEQCTFGTDSIW